VKPSTHNTVLHCFVMLYVSPPQLAQHE